MCKRSMVIKRKLLSKPNSFSDLLPTKFAREESRSLPIGLVAAEAEPVAVPPLDKGWPVCIVVGIRRSPKPSNTEDLRKTID